MEEDQIKGKNLFSFYIFDLSTTKLTHITKIITQNTKQYSWEVSLLAYKFVLLYSIEITNQTNCKYQHKWFLSYFTSGQHARTIAQLGDDVLVQCGMMMSWNLWPTHSLVAHFVFQRATERDNGSSMVCNKAAVLLVSPHLLLWVGGVWRWSMASDGSWSWRWKLRRMLCGISEGAQPVAHLIPA